jgi:hypothetical protein
MVLEKQKYLRTYFYKNLLKKDKKFKKGAIAKKLIPKV